MTSKELVGSYTYELVKNKFHKDFILGIGTGSTANCFIEIIKKEKPEFKALVSSSEASSDILKSEGFEISEFRSDVNNEAVNWSRDYQPGYMYRNLGNEKIYFGSSLNFFKLYS